MEAEPSGTKLALILAAGELFAEHGFDGTSVRAIAEKADANIAAINYHFGGKQDLYIATLLYAIEHGTFKALAEQLGEPCGSRTSMAMAEAIDGLVRRLFLEYLATEEAPWRNRLILRCLLEESPAIARVVDASFRPDVDALRAFARRARPAMSEQETLLWAFEFLGQVSFYVLARPAMLTYLERAEYGGAFLSAAAQRVSRWALATLGLPQPPQEEGASELGEANR